MRNCWWKGLTALPLLLLLGACASEGGVAEGQEPEKPTAVVAMGDSFISGEGGRWLGNSQSGSPDRGGTDRAFVERGADAESGIDVASVYGDTVENGCHRSDVADIISSGIEVDALINLACSGASTRHLWRASNGGEVYKGEAPQADQLAAIAADHYVEMIVISVGGNDLGYSDIATECGVSFVTNPFNGDSRCTDAAEQRFDRSLPTAVDDVAKAVDEVHAVMAAAGQSPDTYRLVLRTYPSPLPRSDDNRLPASAIERLREGGCPFGDAASNWANDVFAPRLAQELEVVAEARGAELLNVTEAFLGHELCASDAQQVGDGPPDGATAEWVRWVDFLFRQGSMQESMHPNAFGQIALGRCIALTFDAEPSPVHTCHNTPRQGPEAMRLVHS